MGVSGSGKTTVGSALAEQLEWHFFDADAYHPQTNIDKMARGHPLTDADRQPWLERLRDLIREHIRNDRPCVLACSALKQHYRDVLQGDDAKRVTFVYLKSDADLIRRRMEQREHFMRPALLQSQFDIIEEPTNAVVVTVDRPIDEIVRHIIRAYTQNASPD